jgi:hypothetical protein
MTYEPQPGFLQAPEGSPSLPPRSQGRQTERPAAPSRRGACCRITTTPPTACLARRLVGSPRNTLTNDRLPAPADRGREITHTRPHVNADATNYRHPGRHVAAEKTIVVRILSEGLMRFPAMRIPTMGALPPLQGEGWGGDGVIMHGKDGSFPHPPPNTSNRKRRCRDLPLERGGVPLANLSMHRNSGMFFWKSPKGASILADAI